MKFYRNTFVRKTLVLLTGVLVLNMSFFLAEVEALKLLHNKQMVENIAKLIMGAATEEEKDLSGAAEESGLILKEIDLLFSHEQLLSRSFTTLNDKNHHPGAVEKVIVRSSDTISPPPKRKSILNG